MPDVSRRLAYEVLLEVDDAGGLAREALDGLAERVRPDPRDRDLASEIALGVLRREDSLDAILTLRLKKPLRQQDPAFLRVLRIGAYQILLLDRVPPHAAISTAVDLAREIGLERATGAVNAILRAVEGLVAGDAAQGAGDPRRSLPRGDGTDVVLREDAFPDPRAFPAGNLATRYGVPVPAVERWMRQHGERAVRQILEASIARPPVAVRPRRGREAEVEAAFTAAGIAFEREGPCLLVRGTGDVRSLPLWREAAFAIQDPTAAEVAPALAPPEGAAVLDVCAAPGGKSLALSEIVGPAGRVVAVDVPGPRTAKMSAELARRGAANVEVVAADATRADALPHGPVVAGVCGGGSGGMAGPAAGAASGARGFDLVLVDAPCSNSGVLAKRVEARRRLRDGTSLASLVLLQTKLLDAAATRVRPGGRLAWSTCSVDDEENGARVRAFLASHPGFALVSERLTLPVPSRRDGGYLAVLAAPAPA